MLHTTILLAVPLVLPTQGPSQTSMPLNKMLQPARNAGVLHLASGTWTRGVSGATSLGADIVYRNDADTGYNSSLGAGSFTVDEGRLPGFGGNVPGADRLGYRIEAFDFRYCAEPLTGTFSVEFEFYDSYEPCSDPNSVPSHLAATIEATNLPGGQGPGAGINCWTVTVDLSGGEEFCMQADGGPLNPGYDGVAQSDSFGWGVRFLGLPANDSSSGLVIAGDPAYSLVAGGGTVGGGGTYYEPGSAGCLGETGLDSEDLFFWNGGQVSSPGCYFFGQYNDGPFCGAIPQTIPGSFYLTLYADPDGCLIGLTDCETGGIGRCLCQPAAPHVGGTYAKIRASGSASASDDLPLHLDCSDGPSFSFGYFLVSGAGMPPTAVANGNLCLGGTPARFSQPEQLGFFDDHGDWMNVASGHPGLDLDGGLPDPIPGNITSGSTWYFQLWFREGPGFTNFSSAVGVQFE